MHVPCALYLSLTIFTEIFIDGSKNSRSKFNYHDRDCFAQ